MAKRTVKRYNHAALMEALSDQLIQGRPATQSEICQKLAKLGFPVNQSTVSRLLKRLHAIKATDNRGRTVYRLLAEDLIPGRGVEIRKVVRGVYSNGNMIVIHTATGCAQLVAQYLDQVKPSHVLGTVAGDDTIFVAPDTPRVYPSTVDALRELLQRATLG